MLWKPSQYFPFKIFSQIPHFGRTKSPWQMDNISRSPRNKQKKFIFKISGANLTLLTASTLSANTDHSRLKSVRFTVEKYFNLWYSNIFTAILKIQGTQIERKTLCPGNCPLGPFGGHILKITGPFLAASYRWYLGRGKVANLGNIDIK